MSTTERAFANLANIGPSEAEKAQDREVQRAISKAMVDVVRRDAHHDVHYMDPLGVSKPGQPASRKVTPQGAAKVADDPRPSLLPGIATEPVKPRLRDWIREGEPKAGEEKE
jgi:hypothetical protein